MQSWDLTLMSELSMSSTSLANVMDTAWMLNEASCHCMFSV